MKKIDLYFYMCVVFLLLCFTVNQAKAFYGELTSDTTWQDSVFITGDIYVQTGVTLTINQGTVVRFLPDSCLWDMTEVVGWPNLCDIISRGVIKILGTPQDSVIFTSAAVEPECYDWGSIYIVRFSKEDTLSDTIKFAVFKYALNALCIYSEYTDSTTNVSHCTFKDNQVALDIYDTASPLVRYCNFLDNRTGFCGGAEVSPLVTHCTFWDNHRSIFLCEWAVPEFHYCDIYNQFWNNGYEDIDATYNYWGTTDPDSIEGLIIDGLDSPQWWGIVDYSKWLDEPVGVIEENDHNYSNSLLQVFPTLFSSCTTIHYKIPLTESKENQVSVSLSIYDLSGRLVRNLFTGNQEPGIYTVVWDGRGKLNERVSSGIYLIRFECEGLVESKKIVVFK